MPHILLVEDDPDTAQAVQCMLEVLGHRVTWAANGLEALRAAGETSPDLVITDMLMPEMDGIEVVLTFTEHFAEVPILAMSAQQDAPYMPSAKVLGARAFLAKPFNLESLREALEGALSQAGETPD